MKSSYCIALFLLLIASSCKINQKKNRLKEGRWVIHDTINEDVYKYIEKYKKGNEVGKWKTFKNKKLYKLENHKKDICYITYYDENRTIIVKGQTKSQETTKETHWYYYGDWLFYNEKGKLIKIKNYELGELKSEIEIP